MTFRKLAISEIPRLPPGLQRDPLGARVWLEIRGLSPGEALELPGRAQEARRIGRAVARLGREEGKEFRVWSAEGNLYIARLS